MTVESMVKKSTLTYSGVKVYVTKISKQLDIRGSVDGNKFGESYDVTVQSGFSDKSLISEGYTELTGQNGSIFYTYDGDAYAEGIEVSKGVNNQDFNMSCVSDFDGCMAIGFPYDGGIVIDLQKNIKANWWDYYGAITGAFGIMKNGVKNDAGKSLHGSYYSASGRSIIAQDDSYIYSIVFYGVTGKSGLKGTQLYGLLTTISAKMKDGVCFDGGGSVFGRTLGEYVITTTRKVKNGVMLFGKLKAEVAPEPEETAPEENASTENGISFRTVKCIKGTLNNGTEYPTRKTINSDWDRNGYKIKVGDRLIFDDVKPINGKPDCYFQIVGGDRTDLIGRWFAYDKNYFD